MKGATNSGVLSGAITFHENAVYNTDMAAKILRRSPKTVRALCRRGLIVSRCDRGGFLMTGWSIRNYLENKRDLERQF